MSNRKRKKTKKKSLRSIWGFLSLL